MAPAVAPGGDGDMDFEIDMVLVDEFEAVYAVRVPVNPVNVC